jgi:hypothetical protein
MRWLTPVLAVVLVRGMAPGVCAAQTTEPATAPAGPVVQAATTSIRDLLSLKAAGVSDDILVALIESDDSVFRLTAQDILDLRAQGLSERVILAMLATMRKPVARGPIAPGMAARDRLPEIEAPVGEATTSDAALLAAIQELDRTGTLARDAPREPPVILNVTQQVEQYVEVPERVRVEREYVPVAVPVAVPVRSRHDDRDGRGRHDVRAAAPQRWGWGGQPAPGTWETRVTTSPGRAPKEDVKPDSKPDERPASGDRPSRPSGRGGRGGGAR